MPVIGAWLIECHGHFHLVRPMYRQPGGSLRASDNTIIAPSLESAHAFIPRGLQRREYTGGFIELVEYWA